MTGGDRITAKPSPCGERLVLPAGGLEAEFSVLVDDEPVKPEDVFGDPRAFLTVPVRHRTGKSFQLPNGAAVYFDTGVIEVATPPMELERGCFGRLSRSLHEGILMVRRGLDAWEARNGRRVRLQGFSAHYNVSLDSRGRRPGVPVDAGPARIGELAWALAHVLPAPVMLLATTPLSTGVGVRPRPRRIEVTVDFTPDMMRVAATGAVIAGVVQAMSRWTSLDVPSLRRRGIPVVQGFTPMKHTSRRGWLARFDCYDINPFQCDPDAARWLTSRGPRSLRAIARRVLATFEPQIRRVADPASYRVATRVVDGRTPSWLDGGERPPLYDDVGRDQIGIPYALRRLGQSRYERALRHVLARRPITLDGERWLPLRVRGWAAVEMGRERDGHRRTMTLDELLLTDSDAGDGK